MKIIVSNPISQIKPPFFYFSLSILQMVINLCSVRWIPNALNNFFFKKGLMKELIIYYLQ